MNRDEKIKILEEKLKGYEEKLAKKSLGFGDVVRTRFGDSYEDQLRDETNVLRGMISSIKEEIESLKK
jgi:hypothetical protein